MIERNTTSPALDRLFDEIYNIISEASRIPLTDKVIIEESDIAGILDELKAAIPKEIRNADLVLEEQRSIVNKAYEEADRIVQQAKAEAERIVGVANAEAERVMQEEEIVKQANAVAEEVRANALRYQEEAKAEADDYVVRVKADADDYALRVKHDSLQYADDMLAYLGNNLQSALQGLSDNRASILAERKILGQPAGLGVQSDFGAEVSDMEE